MAYGGVGAGVKGGAGGVRGGEEGRGGMDSLRITETNLMGILH